MVQKGGLDLMLLVFFMFVIVVWEAGWLSALGLT